MLTTTLTVASHLESQIKSHTNDLTILNLQRTFTNLTSPLLSPGRQLLKSGLLRKLDRRGNEQTRTFFLFNDVLVHASGEGGGWATATGLLLDSGAGGGWSGQYRLHKMFELEDVTVIGSEESGVGAEEGRKWGFELLSSEKSFALYAGELQGTCFADDDMLR